jgi:hypothetical protein
MSETELEQLERTRYITGEIWAILFFATIASIVLVFWFPYLWKIPASLAVLSSIPFLMCLATTLTIKDMKEEKPKDKTSVIPAVHRNNEEPLEH